MNETFPFRRVWLGLLFFYLIALGVRIHYVHEKDGVLIDDVWTVVFAQYNKHHNFSSLFEPPRTFSGREIKDRLLNDTGESVGLFNDLSRLWVNDLDSSHPPFYYALFRLAMLGVDDATLSAIIFRGAMLNLLLFTVSFFGFFATLKLVLRAPPPAAATIVWKNLLAYDLAPAVATLCAFLSTATISNTLFFRPYQLMETCFIVFAYVFFRFFDDSRGGGRRGAQNQFQRRKEAEKRNGEKQ
ncbi:hypothetical protein FACS1894108_04020 [Planctomycetales bacterium]|nr:hypothetical protein FACS1894108_04020 [Planctomycetales bacterium]